MLMVSIHEERDTVNIVPDCRPRYFKHLFLYLVWATCQKHAVLVALHVTWQCTWFTEVKRRLKLSERLPVTFAHDLPLFKFTLIQTTLLQRFRQLS